MTARQVYEAALTELNKVEAPPLLLADYNYFINKAVSNVVNKRYSVYDENQQARDDLRVLEGTAIITSLTPVMNYKLQGACYIGQMPSDYLHILSCIAEYRVSKKYKCFDTTTQIYKGARRLTAAMYPSVIDNYYLQPTWDNPYFYMHSDTQPTIVTNQPGVPDEQKTDSSRVGNSSPVTIQLRYGTDNTLFILTAIHADYLKVPQYILLTQDQIDSDEDTSSTIEFPDYMSLEIIRELVMLLMENASDPRLATNPQVSESIMPPAGQRQQAQQQQGQQQR